MRVRPTSGKSHVTAANDTTQAASQPGRAKPLDDDLLLVVIGIGHDLTVPEEFGVADLPGVVFEPLRTADHVVEPVGGIELEVRRRVASFPCG